MTKHPFPFSWKALLIAPLVIAVPAALLFVGGSGAPVAAFGLLLGAGYVFTLAMVGGLLLPALWLVSRLTSIRAWVTSVIGGTLAAPIFVVFDYFNWSSSGVDSGPPAMTYPQWIAKNWLTAEPLVFISLGVVTAASYHFLATSRPPRIASASATTGSA